MWPFRRETRLGPAAMAELARLREQGNPEERFWNLVAMLLEENPKTSAALDGSPPNRNFTAGQEILASLALLDYNVNNGGALQLFWNCLGRVEHIAQSLRTIGLDDLAREFDRDVEQFGEKFDEFEPVWAGTTLKEFRYDYLKASALYEFGWFDDMYYGRSENGKMVRTGANDALYQVVLKYVYAHLDQFVQLPRGGG